MCVIGNPPYLATGGGEKGKYAQKLVEDYKKEPGTNQKMRQPNIRWLNDLYVQFIRMSSDLIERHGEGVLGFITNNSYLDKRIYKGMRYHLLQTFDKIWVVDLRGDYRRRDRAPDGTTDENVFGIGQGVSIIIAAKHNSPAKGLAEINNLTILGSKKKKLKMLESENLSSINFKKVKPQASHYIFSPRNYKKIKEYEAGFSLDEFMPFHQTGLITGNVNFTIALSIKTMKERIHDLANLSIEELRQKYGKLVKNVGSWALENARDDIRNCATLNKYQRIAYRSLDIRWTFYTGNKDGFMHGVRRKLMHNMLLGGPGLVFTTGVEQRRSFTDIFVLDTISQTQTLSRKESAYVAPLYLHPEGEMDASTKKINFNHALYKQMQELVLGKKGKLPEQFEVSVLDYIYASLHCPKYRKQYDEYLKDNFPAVPWPSSARRFRGLAQKGKELREIHLMKSSEKWPEPVCIKEDWQIGKCEYKEDSQRVYINDNMYFEGVPSSIWNLEIGGLRPAEEWLKARKGEEFDSDGLQHYRKILQILFDTGRIMTEIGELDD